MNIILSTLTLFFLRSSCATDKRIVGGRVANQGEFPFQVSIRRSYNDGHFCGGTLITNKHVLTAAHCCYYPWGGPFPSSYLSVFFGQTLLSEASDYRNASKIITHPNFDGSLLVNDIAVIELDKSVHFDKIVSGLSLRNYSVVGNVSCTVSGWGFLSYDSSLLSNELLATDVYVLQNEECQKRYDVVGIRLFSGMLCAVNDQKASDACQGDSGGPLVCEGVLTGVVSSGIECGNSSFPGIYTDVGKFLPWLQEIVNLPLLVSPGPNNTSLVVNHESNFGNLWDNFVSFFSGSASQSLQNVLIYVIILFVFMLL